MVDWVDRLPNHTEITTHLGKAQDRHKIVPRHNRTSPDHRGANTFQQAAEDGRASVSG